MRETRTIDYQHEAFAAGRFLRVVNWHNTPEAQRGHLRATLSWYLDRFVPVLPEDLDRFVETGAWHLPKPGFVPVFYDSFLNNATVAAPVCDELGIRAWFFTPTTFLSIPPAEQRDYADAHDIDLVEEERDQPTLAMTWDHLEQVSRRHVVAAHTANHTAQPDIVTAEDIEREITEPIRQITEVTGSVPPAFAFLYGTPPDPETPAGAAVIASGVRYATTNTSYLRIHD